MPRSAVLFDLDGTLLDTIEDLGDSMNAVLRSLGLPLHDYEAYKVFVGDGIRNLVMRALPEERRDEGSLKHCRDLLWAEYSKRWRDKTRPYADIPEMLDALAARNIAMAILSNKPDEFTQKVVGAMLSRWRFAAVQGMREGVPIKPDPSAALDIAGKLGIAPADFVYLGDTGTDMKTAASAGMFAVGALWGFRSGEELAASGARMLIRSPLELLPLFRTA
ncbi:MAG TPA: HAD family hydrolase [Planctomycetes bacterium]|nr:HAD family hydrolase [Planctomycetota bacterium]